MRYIFILLIVANVVLLAFVLYDKDEKAITDVTQADIKSTENSSLMNPLVDASVSKKQVSDAVNENLAKQQSPVHQPTNTISNEKTLRIDQSEPTIPTEKGASGVMELAEMVLPEPVVSTPIIENYSNWVCVQIKSEETDLLQELAEQYQLDTTIQRLQEQVPRSTMIYIAASSSQEAQSIRARVIDLGLVKDPYISRYQDQSIVSVGVFRSENSIRNISRIFTTFPEFKLQQRQLFTEKVSYKIIDEVPQDTVEQLVQDASKKKMLAEVIKNKKDCK